MPPIVATVLFVSGIIGLFWLTQDNRVKTSPALWIPISWFLICGSRPVSYWFDLRPRIESATEYLEGSPMDASVFAVLMVAAIAVLLTRKGRTVAILRSNGPILLFLAYCLLSTLWSHYTFVSFKHWVKIVGDVAMVLVVLTELDPTVAIRRVLARVGFLLLPASVLFIKYYPNIGRSYNLWNWEPMYGGVSTTKNGLGMICLVYGLGSLWCFLVAYKDDQGRQRTRRMIAHAAILTMVVWLLYRSNSMTSISCFVIAGGLLTVTSLNRVARRPASVHLLVVAAIAVTASTLFLGLGSGALETMGRNSTLTGRTDIWHIVLSIAGNPFIGTGFESFWLGTRLKDVWRDYGLHIQEAHNGYLEVYLNLGWIGICLLLSLIYTGYKNVIRSLRRKEEVSYLKLAFILASVIYSFTEAGFRMLSPTWTAFLLAILALPQKPTPEIHAPMEIVSSVSLSEFDLDVEEPVSVRLADKDF